MSITITNRKGNQSIRATGKDAQALFDAMCQSVEKYTALKASTEGQNAAPDRPKDEIQGSGTATGLSRSQASGE